MMLEQILKRARSALVPLEGALSNRRRVHIYGIFGSAKALTVAHLCHQLRVPILYIAGELEEAESMVDDLEAFLGSDGVCHFAPWDVLPYEDRSPHRDVVGQRLEALSALARADPVAVVTSVRALFQGVPSPWELPVRAIDLEVGQKVDREDLLRRLLEMGFELLPLVEEVGNFSVRGGIVDVFPFGYEDPIRMEFFGPTVESIREFDVATQRTVGRLETCHILPCRETVQMGNRQSVIDHLPSRSVIFLDEPNQLEMMARGAYSEALRFHAEALREGREVPAPAITPVAIEEKLSPFQQVKCSSFKNPDAIEIPVAPHPAIDGDLNRLRSTLRQNVSDGLTTYILCDNRGQAERLEELLEEAEAGARIMVGSLHDGFVFPRAGLAVFTDHQIFNRYRRRRRRRRYREGVALSSYTALSEGDYVVHIDHGVGRYLGLRRINAEGREIECACLAYAGDDRLYVPVDQMNRLQKYVGREGTPPRLSTLGGVAWERAKRRAKRAIRDMAQELIQLYAERKAKRGFSFSPDTEWQRELEASFIYDETPDQLAALEAIKRDMEEPVPMDRLVCGDVGYGKTEVAVRAAFKAIMAGKQVAVLVPTTVLAQQHLTTFAERLADFPVRVEMLSRFKTRREQSEIVDGLLRGSVDIVIGTHRLIQKDVQFKDLGLVIVDEEQRFGVVHKERLKKLRRLVDVLTLTATPIPRTLHLSLMGARDMSIINTPPKDRLSVETEIVPFDPEIIADALLREVDRGGQIYFVHNRVQSIAAMGDYLNRLVPEIRLEIAHGQMPERDLERVMLDFLNHRFDCLVTTTIIESGIDIPNVNTIVINRSDRFGLAQLYQLRGRVGRSSRRAYAYLLIPKIISSVARKRLEAIQRHTELGSGFHLAMRDLEIRGAGNILGEEQHGFIEVIGFDLYCKLLEQAVKELKGEAKGVAHRAEVRLDVRAFLPEEYVPDETQRIAIYQRLMVATTPAMAQDIGQELRDRYGPLPDEAHNLVDSVALAISAGQQGIASIGWEKGWLSLAYGPEVKPSPDDLSTLVKRANGQLEFAHHQVFKAMVYAPEPSGERQLRRAKNLLLFSS